MFGENPPAGRTDVLFVYMNAFNENITGAEYQLDCAYMQCYLKKSGIRCSQYIAKDPASYHAILREWQGIPVQAFVFYINEYNYAISRLLVNHLKAGRQDALVICTGPSAECIAENSPGALAADLFVFQNDFFALKEILCREKDRGAIANIAYYKDKLVKTAREERVYSLDDIGFVFSAGLIPPGEVQNTGMISSTGCTGECLFCSYNNKPGSFRLHSVEGVIAELQYIQHAVSAGGVKISFLDDCFSVSNKRTLELCREIIKNRIHFRFWCCTRGDLLSEDLIDTMAQAGFRDIVIGLETASFPVLEKLGKLTKNTGAAEYLNHTRALCLHSRKNKLNPHLSINLGLPSESMGDAAHTVQFIKSLDFTSKISVNFMTCFPGSKVFGESEKYGIRKTPAPTFLPYRTFYHNFHMGHVQKQLLNEGILHAGNYMQQAVRENLMSRVSAFFSGVDPYTGLSASCTAIMADTLDEQSLGFIDKNLHINGSVLLPMDKLTLTSTTLFCDDRKNLRIAIKQFDDNLASAYRQNRWPAHQVFIKREGNSLRLQPDNHYFPAALILKLYEPGNRADLDYLAVRSRRFYEKESLTGEDLEIGLVANSCSFTGRCDLCTLKRLQIKKNRCYACTAENAIGTVGSERAELLAYLSTLFLKKQTARGCKACPAGEYCSRCVFLPGFLQDEDYCSLVRDHPFFVIYMNALLLIQNLRLRYGKQDQDADPAVYPARKYFLNSEPAALKLKADILLVEWNHTCLVYSIKQRKLLPVGSLDKKVLLDICRKAAGNGITKREYCRIVLKWKNYGIIE